MRKHCPACGQGMQRWGKTAAGTIRYFCSPCKKSIAPRRSDLVRREKKELLESWLGGKESLSFIAREVKKSRQALWREFHPLFLEVAEPFIPWGTKSRILIVDGTYVHGHNLCALIAIDENDKIYWKFTPYESQKAWLDFLSHFACPEIIIMDGQKGLFAAAKMLWSEVPVQRCQFHVVSFAIQYLGRRPKEAWGKDLLAILYDLKEAKSHEKKVGWLKLYHSWERKYENILSAKHPSGQFMHPRLRSVRLIIRRALPNLFTFLDHVEAPNTTNLVEGWINGAIAEALRLHRGLKAYEKKMLVSVILSKLKRKHTAALRREENERHRTELPVQRRNLFEQL